MVCSKCGGKFIMCDCSLPSRVAPNQPLSESVVERVARAICAASGETWRTGTYEVASGRNFEVEDHLLDPFNNHWRHKARAAIAAIPSAGGVETQESLGALEGVARCADLQLALDWALQVLERYEPGDSRAVSDEFVSAAAIACDCANQECRDILRAALNSTSPKGGEA
jgi:hypothetical protein